MSHSAPVKALNKATVQAFNLKLKSNIVTFFFLNLLTVN